MFDNIDDDKKNTAIILGAGIAFNAAAYSLDSVIGGLVAGLCVAMAGASVATKYDESLSLFASVLVAVGTFYGASMTVNERKVCFVSPGEELTKNLRGKVSKGIIENDSSQEPNRIASRIIFESVEVHDAENSDGGALPYSTEPSIFSGFADGGRVCPKVGRAAQKAFNADGFDQVGAVAAITAEWTQKYSGLSLR